MKTTSRSGIDESYDEVALLLRAARDTQSRAKCTLDEVHRLRTNAAARIAEVGRTADVQHELLLRDEELAATLDELREQIHVLHRASSLLQEQRAKYLDLFENAPDAYLVTDLRGVLQEASVSAGALFCVEPSFLCNRPLISFVARQDTRAFRHLVEDLPAESRGARTVTLRMRPRGQPVFVVSARAKCLRNDEGRPLALGWLLRRSGATAQGNEVGLARAELARSLTHDLGRQLTTIAGWARLLREDPVGSESDRAKALRWIGETAVAHQRVLDDLLELAELDENPTPHLARVDLTELQALVRSALASMGRDNPRLLALGELGGIFVNLDRARFPRAFEILLRRAIEGCPFGPAAVLVGVSVTPGELTLRIEPPKEAHVPAGWAVRVAIASTIIRSSGCRLILDATSPRADIVAPRA
jgi:PAS domain-containing protein